ncbi:MAG: SGNH/GDSL hydrolase family protein [Hyphomicrobium sp.]|uniref:SGNH/GDSL hydrolase family protein n=1 Tax=Hyphomicrobium sp. TaxID=82 RepID=UPI003D0E404A
MPPELVELHAPLPNLTRALNAHEPIRIVALGSSSTWGTGATSPERTYPARLEQELNASWPKGDVRVINAGVRGQLAREMLARIDRDVAPFAPQLVLWQTGVNDAIRGVAIDSYRQQLTSGIERLRAVGADVVLIDQQFYPGFAKLKNGPLYMTTLREVAAQLGVPVMQRFAIMKHLISSAQFTTASLLSPDQFHLNDRSYDCLGRILAQSLRSAAASPAREQAADKDNARM